MSEEFVMRPVDAVVADIMQQLRGESPISPLLSHVEPLPRESPPDLPNEGEHYSQVHSLKRTGNAPSAPDNLPVAGKFEDRRVAD